MTPALEQAFRQVRELPAERRDSLVRFIAEEIEQQRFDALIASRPDVLRQMADKARAEHRAGLTRPLTDADFCVSEDHHADGA